MPTAKSTSGQSDVASVMAQMPAVMGGEELYNKIMGQIEPDLTTEGLLLISEKYRKETSGKKKSRMKRYEDAILEYKKQLSAYNAAWDGQMHGLQNAVRSAFETDNRQDETQQMGDLEAAINSL